MKYGVDIYNGNNYSEQWIQEASIRGLHNLKTTVDALPYYVSDKNTALFAKHNVLTESELYSRYEILLENYYKTIHIEALTMIDMIKKEIIPAVLGYQGELANLANSKRALDSSYGRELEQRLLKNISKLGDCLYEKLESLESSVLDAKNYSETLEMAHYYREVVFLNMQSLRGVVDELETLVSKKHWTLPTYAEILYSVH